jgi:hypothetical protein
MENLLNPYSDIRMLLSGNQDRYRIARKILWQILQNHYAHSLGTPQYSLSTFPADAAGYISRSDYAWIGRTALTEYRIGWPHGYYWLFCRGSWDIIDLNRTLPDVPSPGNLAHANPTILYAVIKAEDQRAVYYAQAYREEKERRVRMGLER